MLFLSFLKSQVARTYLNTRNPWHNHRDRDGFTFTVFRAQLSQPRLLGVILPRRGVYRNDVGVTARPRHRFRALAHHLDNYGKRTSCLPFTHRRHRRHSASESELFNASYGNATRRALGRIFDASSGNGNLSDIPDPKVVIPVLGICYPFTTVRYFTRFLVHGYDIRVAA